MVDKESQFEVLTAAEETAPEPGSCVTPEPKAPLCILLAEDDELIRTVTSRILEHAGHQVLLAKDGDEAIELFDARRTEIVIAVLDVVMPKRSGKSVYAHIRKSCTEIPVLFTTGYSPVELEPLLEADPAAALLHKPYRSVELLSELERMSRR